MSTLFDQIQQPMLRYNQHLHSPVNKPKEPSPSFTIPPVNVR